jgi:dihydroflavonol-4-reductase
MTVAITGASGQIGNNICRALLERGFKVRALLHIHSNALEGLDVEKIRGNVLDPASLNRFFEGADFAVHAAGKISINGDRDGSVYQVNVIGTRNVVETCLAKGVRRLVYVSSIHALQQDPAIELDETRPLVGEGALLHDLSKSEGEKEVLKIMAQGLDTIILNPTAVVGPHDFKPSLLGQGLIALYNRKVPALISGGFDWVDVRDVAKAAVIALEKGKSGDRYLISGMWKTVRELALLVQDVTGKSVPKFTSPHWLARMGIPLVKAYSFLTNGPALYTQETLEVLLRCNRNINCSKAKRELSFHPRPLAETLKDTFSWYKQTGMID